METKGRTYTLSIPEAKIHKLNVESLIVTDDNIAFFAHAIPQELLTFLLSEFSGTRLISQQGTISKIIINKCRYTVEINHKNENKDE